MLIRIGSSIIDLAAHVSLVATLAISYMENGWELALLVLLAVFFGRIDAHNRTRKEIQGVTTTAKGMSNEH